MSRFPSAGDVAGAIMHDLAACCGADVCVSILPPASPNNASVSQLPGICLDALRTSCNHYCVSPDLLQADESKIVSEDLHSNLLRSLCPVTSQPDIGSVLVSYRGPKIDRESLLHYIVSFRPAPGFFMKPASSACSWTSGNAVAPSN